MTTNALMALLQKKKQEIDAGNRAKTVGVPDKTSRWRILPGWSKDKPDFFHDFGRHFIKGPDGKMKAVYVCVDKTYGKPCSICTAIETAINNTPDPEMKKVLEGARSSKRILLNALHLDGKEPSVPVILEVPRTVFDHIVRISEEWEGRTISVEKDAVDLLITKEGTGLTTKYSVQPAAKPAKVDPSVMDKVTDLDQYVAQENEEQANRALTSIAAVAGLLPPSVDTPAVRPALSRPVELHEVAVEDMEIIEEKVLEDLENGIEPAPAVAPAKAAAKSAPTSSGDPGIDEMLAELGMS